MADTFEVYREKARRTLQDAGYTGEPTAEALEAAGFDAAGYLRYELSIPVKAAVSPEGKEFQAALAEATAEAKKNAQGADILAIIAKVAKIGMKFIA